MPRVLYSPERLFGLLFLPVRDQSGRRRIIGQAVPGNAWPVLATVISQIRWSRVSRMLPITSPTRKTISHYGLARVTPTTSRPITTTQLEISGIRAEGVNISPCRSRRASLIHQAANIVGRRIPKAKIVSRGKSKPRPTTAAATSTSCAANHLMAFAPSPESARAPPILIASRAVSAPRLKAAAAATNPNVR